MPARCVHGFAWCQEQGPHTTHAVIAATASEAAQQKSKVRVYEPSTPVKITKEQIDQAIKEGAEAAKAIDKQLRYMNRDPMLVLHDAVGDLKRAVSSLETRVSWIEEHVHLPK
jgi:hypothetical protein